MTTNNEEILGAGGRGAAGGDPAPYGAGGDPAPYGFFPESYYDWSGQTDTTTTIQAMVHGTSWGDGEYGVGEGGRKLICIACDGTQTKESAADWTSSPTTDVLMSVTGLKPGYSYFVRAYAQNNRYYTSYSLISRPAWHTDATGTASDIRLAVGMAVSGVWKDKIQVKATGLTGNTKTVSCKVFYVDVTDGSATSFTFKSTSAQSVSNTGSKTFTITGLTPGHDYAVSMQKTYNGVTICDQTQWVRLPSTTTDTATQKVVDTGWQTLYEELMFGEQRKNVVTATRLNNAVTLSVSEQYRHAAFPTRYGGRDWNLSGEDVASQSFWQATTLKSSSRYNGGSEQSWLTLGTYAANATLNTPLSQTRTTFTQTVSASASELQMSMGLDNGAYETFWLKDYYGGDPLYIPIPEAGQPPIATLSNCSVAPTNTGASVSLTISGSSWGQNCTGGTYSLQGELIGDSIPTEEADISLSHTASGAIGSHTFNFETSQTNTIGEVAGWLQNDAGLVSDVANDDYTVSSVAAFVTSPAAPRVVLATNDGTSATFTFSGQSSNATLPETYYWRLGENDSWHTANEAATGLTTGRAYTVQVKTTTDIDDADWETIIGTPLPEGVSAFGGGDSTIVNGLTFVAGGGAEIAEPHIWTRRGLSNEKIIHLYTKVNGVKKRLSKVYVKVDGENKLIFRDYYGAHDVVDRPTIIGMYIGAMYSGGKIVFEQDVSEGVFVNWGDGSQIETFSGTGAITATHTYSPTSDVEIVLTPLKSCTLKINQVTQTSRGGNIK